MQSLTETTNRRILVIDDNPAIHEDFHKILGAGIESDELLNAEAAFFGTSPAVSNDSDFQIDDAEQGQQALEMVEAAIAENRRYAMAFVDMRMPPGWDGLTTIERIWAKDPDMQIVICTAYSDNTWSDICERLGRSEQLLILKKPFDNVEVSQLALALTEKWTLTQQARLKQTDLERMVEEQTIELRKQEERIHQKQRLESIGELASGVAHEFNNLLQTIRGFGEFILEDSPEGDPRRDDVRKVLDATIRGGNLTKQLLGFGRKLHMRKTSFDVNELVRGMAELVKPSLSDETRVTLELDAENPTVFADPSMIQQAILNLAFNARDAMPAGGRLTLSTENLNVEQTEVDNDAELGAGEYVSLTVRDTGTGIPPEILKRIFEPFFTTKEVGDGSGLGLAQVYGTIRQLGGNVKVCSRIHEGTAFELIIPTSNSLRGESQEIEHPGPRSRDRGDEPKESKSVVAMSGTA